MTNTADHQPVRYTQRQAARLIHDLWKKRVDVDYQRADAKLRIAAGLSVAVLIVGVIIGEQAGRREVVGIAVAIGLLTFVIALFKASSNYKHAYRRFVVEHLADDGTFLFCPQCQAALGAPQDAQVKRDPPTSCPECGAGPWKFERPVENPKHAAERSV